MARSERPTIRDVAQHAGVSVTTVSNVVNNRPHVKTATRELVLNSIGELGYRASRAAKSLPAGRTFLLGYCLPDDKTPNPALDVFLHHMVNRASDADLEVLLFTQRGDDPVEPYAQMLRQGGADGFVLSGIEYNDPRVRFLAERNVPFACFGRVDEPTVGWVDVDGAAGVAQAVGHLHDTGHDRIAFVAWPEGSATGDDRLGGFTTRAEQLGLDTTRVVRTPGEFDNGRKLVSALIDDHDPTAIVCVSDSLALGVMAGLRDLGLTPGDDVAVIGFDDTPAASLTAPGLTSVRQPMEQVGALLVEQVLAQLTGEGQPTSALVEPDLIVRQSSGPRRR